MGIWVRTDDYILELDQLIHGLEQGQLSQQRLRVQRDRIDAINDALHNLEKAFSETLGAADRSLTLVLFFSVSLVFLLATLKGRRYSGAPGR